MNLTSNTGSRTNVTLNIRSSIRSHSTAQLQNGVLTLTFDADPGTTQIVEASDDLEKWLPIHTNVVSGAGSFEFLPALTWKHQFFRLEEWQ
jgi:hypothetical protein